jgi:hypothetical protein
MVPVKRLIRRVTPCILAIAAVAIVLSLDAVAWACPTCREGLADNPAGQSLARGFYYSILFMMSMPFLILGTLGTVAYRSVQRAKANQDVTK